MTYTSFSFYILVAAAVIVYYLVPLRVRWVVLLAASAVFYYAAAQGSRRVLALFLLTIVVSYVCGLLLGRNGSAASGRPEERRSSVGNSKGKACAFLLVLSLLLSSAPLLMERVSGFFPSAIRDRWTPVVAVGMSFYTLQIISYLVDVYRGRISPQKNFFQYALFISFFPQILQGPIPRYEQIGPQLFQGNRFRPENIVRGYLLIVWGFFLKFMIADKAGIAVDTVFASPAMYRGGYVLAAGILYSIQLYADFLACTTISQGTAKLFGIGIVDNFHHPYFATSVKDFWRRWHLSLSGWLRDYIYIPLGGNRKGKFRKYWNILLTFAVSGFWHGTGLHFLVWGILHGIYQILGEWLRPFRQRVRRAAGVRDGSRLEKWIARTVTFLLVMFAWILFRAPSLQVGADMIGSVFLVQNPWIFWDDSLLQLGLGWKDWAVLLLSVGTLYLVSREQEKGIVLTDRLLAQPLFFRWIVYIAAALAVMVFGSYGFGFQASDFIYMKF